MIRRFAGEGGHLTNTDTAGQAHNLPLASLMERHATYRTAIRWAGIAFLAIMAEQGVAALSGKSTDVLVAASLSLFSELKFTVAVTLAAGSTGWALLERYFRRKKTEELATRIRTLELRLDPHRTSSNLLSDGRTNPSDRRA